MYMICRLKRRHILWLIEAITSCVLKHIYVNVAHIRYHLSIMCIICQPKEKHVVWSIKVVMSYNQRVLLTSYILIQRLNIILYLVSHSGPIHIHILLYVAFTCLYIYMHVLVVYSIVANINNISKLTSTNFTQ